VVVPELDGSTEGIRSDQQTTIESVLSLLAQRAATLRSAADEVLAMPTPDETTYAPISTADAVLRYAVDFIPSWAGAIAIDLLPAVLVLIMMVAQSAIRSDRGNVSPEETMTIAEIRAAVAALRELDWPQGSMPEMPPVAGNIPEASPVAEKIYAPKDAALHSNGGTGG
jgi:hypothetical protein